MKAPARILTLVLAFIFAIPNEFPRSVESIEIIPSVWAQPQTKEECRRTPGWRWDSDQGNERCVRDRDSIKSGAKARECAGLPPERQKECYLNNATSTVGEDDKVESSGGAGGIIGAQDGTSGWEAAPFDDSTLPLIGTMLSAFYLMRKNNGAANCAAWSMYLMIAAGVASVLGEVSANVYYRGRLRDIVKDYRDFTQTGIEHNEDDEEEQEGFDESESARVDEAQVKAFDYLIDQESARQTAATIRSIAYGTAGGLYLASIIASAIEAAQDTASMGSSSSANTCQLTNDDSGVVKALMKQWWIGTIAGVAGAGISIGTELGVQQAKDNGPSELPSEDDEDEDDPQGYFSPINPKNKIEQINNPDFIKQQNMSLPPNYYTQFNLEHPLQNLMYNVLDESTWEMRKISGFRFSYHEANEIERFEIIKRFMHHFIPEAFAEDSYYNAENGKNLDRSGQILDEEGRVKRDVGVGIDILLEIVQLLAMVLMYGGLTFALANIDAVDNFLSSTLISPWGRGIIATILMGWTFTVMGLSIADSIQAGNNIDRIKEIRDNFVAGGGSSFDHCQNRDDPADPMCYCYTQKGKNESRSHSAICQTVWGEGGIPDPTTWGRLANSASGAGQRCVTADNKMHLGGRCPCRRAKGNGKSKGKNQCASVKFGGQIPSVGAMRLFGGMANDTNADLGGGLTGSEIEAARNRGDQAFKMLEKMKKDKTFGPILAKMKKEEKKFENQLSKPLRALASKGVGSAFAAPAQIPSSGNPKDVQKAVKESLKRGELEFNKGGAPVNTAKKADDFNFDFGSDAPAGAVTEDQLADAMNSEYKFDDINNNADASIFQILSIRYQKTGMRKLFEDEKPADTQ